MELTKEQAELIAKGIRPEEMPREIFVEWRKLINKACKNRKLGIFIPKK